MQKKLFSIFSPNPIYILFRSVSPNYKSISIKKAKEFQYTYLITRREIKSHYLERGLEINTSNWAPLFYAWSNIWRYESCKNHLVDKSLLSIDGSITINEKNKTQISSRNLDHKFNSLVKMYIYKPGSCQLRRYRIHDLMNNIIRNLSSKESYSNLLQNTTELTSILGLKESPDRLEAANKATIGVEIALFGAEENFKVSCDVAVFPYIEQYGWGYKQYIDMVLYGSNKPTIFIDFLSHESDINRLGSYYIKKIKQAYNKFLIMKEYKTKIIRTKRLINSYDRFTQELYMKLQNSGIICKEENFYERFAQLSEEVLFTTSKDISFENEVNDIELIHTSVINNEFRQLKMRKEEDTKNTRFKNILLDREWRKQVTNTNLASISYILAVLASINEHILLIKSATQDNSSYLNKKLEDGNHYILTDGHNFVLVKRKSCNRLSIKYSKNIRECIHDIKYKSNIIIEDKNKV